MRIVVFTFIVICFVVALAAISQAGDETLVLYLKLDEGSGDVAGDSSMYGNDGTLRGPVWTEGKYGFGLLFDGTTDVEVPDTEILRLTEEATIAAWIKAENNQEAWGRIVDKSVHPNTGYDLALNADSKVYRWEFFVDGVTYAADGKTPLNDEEWHHVLVTFDNANQEFRGYVDGVAEVVISGMPNGTPIKPNNVPLHLGLYSGGNHHYIGVMDEVAVFNRVVDEDEVQDIMEGNVIAVKPVESLSTTWGSIKSDRLGELPSLWQLVEEESFGSVPEFSY